MPALSKNNLKTIKAISGLSIPNESVFSYPEKIISFGTGVLLKGLPYYFINKANNLGIFKGRILAVKSTPGKAEIDSLKSQDFLYSLQSKGLQNGQETTETLINASISRIIHAQTDWHEVLKAAHNPDLQIVISNTTEIGLNFPPIDDVLSSPPASFPAKLLLFLKERYNAFEGVNTAGMVIIPTELVVNNGHVLKEVLVRLAEENDFDIDFINWLVIANKFCNSLVDRIVTGKPDTKTFKKFEEEFGMADPNLISSETYRLWAIEGDESVKEKLTFNKADAGCIVEHDIEKYRELKLRLLNGSHSLMVGFSFLNGMQSVGESLQNEEVMSLMNGFIFDEIIPSLDIEPNISVPYAHEVLDRFRNPNIEHKLLGITVQYSTKMKARVVPILLKYYQQNGHIPKHMTKGFAYFLKFMQITKHENDQYFGTFQGHNYLVQDLNAAIFAKVSIHHNSAEYVSKILKISDLWGTDLSKLDGFEAEILKHF